MARAFRFHRLVAVRTFRLVPCLLLTLLLGARSPVHHKDKAAWTVMIYQDLDNALEAYGIRNLKEMMQIGGGENVNVIVLCDRSPKSEPKDRYSDEDVSTVKNWSGTRLLRLDRGRLIQIDHWGNTNVADPATLTRFLETASREYAAEKYALIISDHGSGWSGFCVDETHGDKSLSLRELRSALEPFVKEHGKLELVGLDACLMGSFETAQALAPVAHNMVGSEEVAPARGWNWDAMLKILKEKPTANGFDLGRTIIDAYTIHFNQTEDPLAQLSSLGCTLSMIDLDKFGPLQAAVSNLGDKCTDALRKGHAGWVRVAKARAFSEEYGNPGGGDLSGDEEMHDLIQMTEILQQSGEQPIVDAAHEVEIAAKHAISYLMRGPLRPHAGGLSIYFPSYGVDLHHPLSKEYLSQTCARDSRWVNFLSLYSVAVDDFAEPPKLLPVKKSGDVATEEKPVTVVAKTTNDDISKAFFIMAAHNGPDLLMIGKMPQRIQADGVMGQTFRGHWFMLWDKKKVLTCPINDFEPLNGDHTSLLAHARAQLKRPGSDWQEVTMTFHVRLDGPAPHGQLIYIFAETKEGPLHITLQKGDEIRPVYIKITPDAEVGTWVSDRPNSTIVLENPADLSLQWGQVGKGAYQVGFEVVNLADMVDLDFAEIVLQ